MGYTQYLGTNWDLIKYGQGRLMLKDQQYLMIPGDISDNVHHQMCERALQGVFWYRKITSQEMQTFQRIK